MPPQIDLVAPPLRFLAAALHRCPKVLLIALGVSMLAAIATADEIDGPGAQLGLLYTVPIAMITWYVGGVWGAIFAVFGGVTVFGFMQQSLSPQLGPLARAWALASSVASFAIVTGLIWSLRRAIENQRALANTDELTGVPNNRAFRAAAALELARAARAGSPVAALFLDCDHFKVVNDRFGHAAGDRLLRVVARTIAGHIRATDHLARLGGDEFGVLFPGLDAADAKAVVQKLHDRLLTAMQEHRWPVTFSIGVAVFARAPAGVDELLSQIDALQYQAKTTGKNRVVFSVAGPPEPRPSPSPRLAA